MKLVRIIVCIVPWLMFSCQYDPFADNATITKPAFKDITGTYYFKMQTITGDTVKNENNIYVKLNADKTYEVSNIPNVFGDTKYKPLAPISARGKWARDTVGFVGRITGDKPQYSVRLTNTIDAISSIGFMGDKPPYQMIITWDDPDLGQVMIFEKRHRK